MHLLTGKNLRSKPCGASGGARGRPLVAPVRSVTQNRVGARSNLKKVQLLSALILLYYPFVLVASYWWVSAQTPL